MQKLGRTFGQWYSDKILSGTTELSDETKLKMKALVGDEKDPIKKAKLIYNYVQQKSTICKYSYWNWRVETNVSQ